MIRALLALSPADLAVIREAIDLVPDPNHPKDSPVPAPMIMRNPNGEPLYMFVNALTSKEAGAWSTYTVGSEQYEVFQVVCPVQELGVITSRFPDTVILEVLTPDGCQYGQEVTKTVVSTSWTVDDSDPENPITNGSVEYAYSYTGNPLFPRAADLESIFGGALRDEVIPSGWSSRIVV